MAYRRRQQTGPRPSILNEETGSPPSPSTPPNGSSSSSSASSLVAKAIRASSSYRDSSLSSAYGHSALSSPKDHDALKSSSPPSVSSDSTNHEYTSMKSLDEPKHGFWGVLARKAKAILDDDNAFQQSETHGTREVQTPDTATKSQQHHNSYRTPENRQKTDSPVFQKRLGALASSLNSIGGTIGNALEEGLTIVENRTADLIQETRKLQLRKKGSETQNKASKFFSTRQQKPTRGHVQPHMQADLEIQLKASRDVAGAMAAKSKLLIRELKTVKADLAFAKERCAQLEEENRILRESHQKGDNPEDEDLIRLQLETLLAEKARLALENSVFARENRFLNEIVEYHQLKIQDVVYLDEGSEEVSEVYLMNVPPSATNLQTISKNPTFSPPEIPHASSSTEVSKGATTPLSSLINDIPDEADLERVERRRSGPA